MSNKRWRCIWIDKNDIWGTKNICYYCGQRADSIDHVISQSVLRELAALEDGELTKFIISKRVLKVWACRECNSLAGASLQESLKERKQFVKAKLKKRYKKILALPKWEGAELEELGYVLRTYVESFIKVKEWIRQRIAW